jgi:hypothetical protein
MDEKKHSRIAFVRHAHGCALVNGNITGELSDELCREFAFLRYTSSELSRIILDILFDGIQFSHPYRGVFVTHLYMGLDLNS